MGTVKDDRVFCVLETNIVLFCGREYNHEHADYVLYNQQGVYTNCESSFCRLQADWSLESTRITSIYDFHTKTVTRATHFNRNQ